MKILLNYLAVFLLVVNFQIVQKVGENSGIGGTSIITPKPILI